MDLAALHNFLHDHVTRTLLNFIWQRTRQRRQRRREDNYFIGFFYYGISCMLDLSLVTFSSSCAPGRSLSHNYLGYVLVVFTWDLDLAHPSTRCTWSGLLKLNSIPRLGHYQRSRSPITLSFTACGGARKVQLLVLRLKVDIRWCALYASSGCNGLGLS